MWALGNIAGDGASMRDYVLEKGIVKPLIQLVTVDGNVSSSFSITCTRLLQRFLTSIPLTRGL